MSEFPPPKGEPPQVSWEPCCALQADPAYQRSIDSRASQKLIRKIAEEWDWRLCAPLTVSHRADSDGQMAYWVIDGQHRLAAAELRGDILELPCIISQFESFEAEALAFVAINRDRKSVTALDRFHARVAAGEAQAIEIRDLVKAAGLSIARSNDAAQWKPHEIAFPDAVGRAIARDKVAAARALNVLAKAYTTPLLRGADLFAGLAVLAMRYGLSAAQWTELQTTFGAVRQSNWIRERDKIKADGDVTQEEAMAAAIFARLKGAGQSSLPASPGPIVSRDDSVRDLYPETDGKIWCDQCDKRVTRQYANACIDRFCKAKAKAA
jgi:ParB-like chromosome segregation protein Spo0J